MKTFGDLYDKLMAIHEAEKELAEAERRYNSYGKTPNQRIDRQHAFERLAELRAEPLEDA